MIYRKDNLKTQTQIRPDPCPNHPDSPAFRAEIKSTRDGKVRLVQYRCAEGDLNPLGWDFHEPGNFRSGRGECSEPAALNAMKHAVQKENYLEDADNDEALGYIAIMALIGLGAFGFALISPNMNITTIAACTTSILAMVAWRYYRERHKQRNEPRL